MSRVRIPFATALLALAGLTGAHAVGAPGAAAQQASLQDRLSEHLPPEARATVLARIEEAAARGLPARPLEDLALQGIAKGRSGPEVVAALDGLAGDLTRARQALESAGRAPDAAETEAAALALRMGADAGAVGSLARSGPSGRSLSVPLLVLGGLAQRGLPSDEALGRVLERMAARADDAALLGEVPGLGGPGAARPGPPADVTPPGLGSGGHGRPDGPPVAPVGPSGGGRPPVDPPGPGGRPGSGGLPGGPGGTTGPGGS